MKKSLLNFLILFFLFASISCTKETDSKSSTLKKTSLRLAWIPGATFTGDYVASEKGFWEEEGLNVEIVPGGFEYDAIRLVASGANDIGITSGPQLLQARANGVPVVAIGAIIPRSPIGWVSKKGSDIKTPQDFVGKKIGAQFGTHTEVTFEALMNKLDISLDSVERIPVRFDPRPFVVGEVDVLPVYIIDQPVDLRQQGIELNIIDPGEYGVSLAYGNVYFTTEELIENSPEKIKSFVKGAKKGWQYSYNNRQEALNILYEYVENTDTIITSRKLNATLEFIDKNFEGEYQGIFAINDSSWLNTYSILKEFNDIESVPEIEQSYTNRFLE